MTTAVQTLSEYRNLPLDWLVVSPTNPRKTFDEDTMQELAAFVPGHKIGLCVIDRFVAEDVKKAHGSRQCAYGRTHNR